MQHLDEILYFNNKKKKKIQPINTYNCNVQQYNIYILNK